MNGASSRAVAERPREQVPGVRGSRTEASARKRSSRIAPFCPVMSPAHTKMKNEPNIVRLDCNIMFGNDMETIRSPVSSGSWGVALRTTLGCMRLTGGANPKMPASVRFCPGASLKCKRSAMTAGFVKGVFQTMALLPEDNAVMARCLPEGRSQTIVGDLSPSLLLRASAHDRQRSQLKQARSFHTAIRVVRFSIGHQRPIQLHTAMPAHSQRHA